MIERESLKKLCRRHLNANVKNSKYRRQFIYVLFLLFLSLLLLLPMLFHRSPPKVEEKKATLNKINYHSALAANLARLEQLQTKTQTLLKTMPIKSKPIYNKKDSKIQQLRQHAPTRMYAMKYSAVKDLNHSGSTFLDHSAYAKFANQHAHSSVISAQRLTHPDNMVPQGEFIHAVLETAINSDLPGMVRAVVAQPVYSYQGDHVLIPTGSRLIGQYASQTLSGVYRLMVIWQRVLLPNGISITLDSPGSGNLGEAGLAADSVNTHFLQRFGEASLLSIIGAAASTLGLHSSDSNNAVQQYRSAIAQSFQASANKTLQHSVALKPTLRIAQGARITIFVAQDLDFYSVLGNHHV